MPHSKLFRPRSMRRFVAIGIMLIGTWLRLHQLDVLPPEAGYDPAYYGLDAIEILQGARPVYFATNFGREALFSYIVALFYAAIGVGTLGIRLAAAFTGILTLPLIYAASRELARTIENRVVCDLVGTFAMAAAAFSFWHVIWSRYGVRAILIPAFVALTFFLLLRAVRLARWADWLMLGIVLGVSIYTYQVAQLLPIVIGLCGLLLLGHNVATWRTWLAKGVGMFGMFMLMLMPLLRYILSVPGSYNRRLQDVALVGLEQSFFENAQVVLATSLKALGTFVFVGDMEPITNLAGRPTLHIFLFATLLSGIVVTLFYRRSFIVQALYIYLVILFLPAVLAEKAPVAKRAIGTLVPIMMLGGIGLAFVVRRLLRVGLPGRLVALLLVIGGFGSMLFGTYQDYFEAWGSDSALYTHYQGSMAEIGRIAATQATETRLYLSPHAPDHPSVALTAYPRSDDMIGFNGRNCLPFEQATEQPITYILDPEIEGDANIAELQRYYDDGEISAESRHESGRRSAIAFSIPSGSEARLMPANVLNTSWVDGPNLLGWDQDQATYVPGQGVQLSLYLSTIRPMPRNATMFVHLIGSDTNPVSGNTLWAQYDKEPCFGFFPTTIWQDGIILRDTVDLVLPAETPPGIYEVRIGWYLWPELQRFMVEDGSDSVGIGTIEVVAP